MQANHAAYVCDTKAYFGRILDHEDEDQARGTGTKLGTGFSQTCRQWNEHFGTPYPADGVAYRWIVIDA